MGTDLHIYRQVYLLISSLIVGFVVYSAGMIGFVGLIVPHVVRMLVGTDHKKLIPVTALVGAVFLVIADGLCRIIIPRTAYRNFDITYRRSVFCLFDDKAYLRLWG
mgnify:CR=1 FL=1